MKGDKIYADWTEEERQALNYAGKSVGVKWAVLTNFEKFRLFNAKTGETVLNIETPYEYLERLDDLLLLIKENVENGNINKLEERIERPDVDLNFLNLMVDWRLKLARSIYEKIPEINLEKLSLYVQRILDRLVIIRYAEDKWILDTPDKLKAAYDAWKKIGASYINLTNILNELFDGFDKEHDSKIFEKDIEIDKIINVVDNRLLGEIIEGLYHQNFRKFTSDILGSTYESYLESKLVLKEEGLNLESEQQARKKHGIYYTPTYVVDSIVRNTLSKKLEKLWDEVLKLFEEGEYEKVVSKFAGIYEIKVLDPACGSGSFLIKAHDLFVEYHNKYAELVDTAHDKINDKLKYANREEKWELYQLKILLDSPLQNYEKRILKENIYGVDLDETAAEITSINLMLRALKPQEKLPLILYENIKTGDSLINGIDNKQELTKHSSDIKELIKRRRLLKDTGDIDAKKRLEIEIAASKEQINTELNRNLSNYFDNPKHLKPFNWEIEFPEVFYDDNGETKSNAGFDVVVGNPPYITLALGKRQKFVSKEELSYFTDVFQYLEYKGNTFILFTERGMNLLKMNGDLGFIVPNTLLTNYFFEKARLNILNSCKIIYLVNISDKVFKNAEVGGNVIIVLEKEDDVKLRETNQIRVINVKNSEEFSQNLCETQLIEQSTFESLPNRKFLLDDSSINLINIEEKCVKLGEFIDRGEVTLYQGILTGDNKKFLSNTKSTERHRKIIRGKDIERYFVNFGGTYVYFDKNRLWSNTDENKFVVNEKIIIRQTSDHLIAALDTKQYLTLDSTHVLISNKIDIKYLLALFNSRLLNYYYQTIVPERSRTFAQVKHVNLRQLPICLGNPSLQNSIIELVDQIMTLNVIKHDIINSFDNLVKNLNQNKYLEPLKNYIDKDIAKEYGINLTRTEKLIKENKKAKIKNFDVCERGDFLIINVVYVDESREDILKIYFENPTVKQFFHLAIISVKKDKNRAYKSEKEVLGTIINEIKIPRSNGTREEDVDNIKKIMQILKDEYNKILSSNYGDAIVKEFDVEENDKQINEVEEKINHLIYAIYDLSNDDIRVIEESLS